MAFTLTGYFIIALATAIFTGCLVRWQRWLPLMDVPMGRSSHYNPKPRTGGIALFIVFIGASVACLLWGRLFPAPAHVLWTIAGSCFFFTLGLLDDIWCVPEWLRLLFQIGFSLGVTLSGLTIQTLDLGSLLSIRLPPILGHVLTVLWITGLINAFNFMDGVDGMAAQEAAVVGAAMTFITGAEWPLIVSAAAMGFLIFNHQPSKIFMGNSGSYLVGYLLAIFSVIGHNSGNIPIVVYALLLLTFIGDTGVTFIRRFLSREPWLKAHRSHHYQKLTELGFSHAQVAWLNVAYTILLSVCAWFYLHAPGHTNLILTASFLVLGASFLTVDYGCAQNKC